MRACAWLFAAFVAFALPGCQINPAPSEEITLQDDAFRPFVEYATGPIRLSSYPNYILLNGAWGFGTALFLRVMGVGRE